MPPNKFIFALQRFVNISNSTSNTLISGTSYNDSIYNYDVYKGYGGNNVTINAGAGDDSIYNSYGGNDVMINAGAGNDSIYSGQNWGIWRVTIDGGKGNDTIENYCTFYASVTGGEGEDLIRISTNVINSTFDGGAGNDTISFFGRYDTSINGGSGNDSIKLGDGTNISVCGGSGSDTVTIMYDNRILIEYFSGDGNDLITGFNATSTLQISGSGTYSTTKSGSDIIVTVGDGKITLVGAASLSAVNIDGTESSPPKWTLNGTTATYGTSKNTLITISGVKSLNGLSLSGSTVTVADSALNKSTVSINNGYTLKLGNDVTTPTTTTPAGWSISDTTATYKSAVTSAGYTLNNNKINYVKESGGNTLITVNGVKSTNGLSLSGRQLQLKIRL